MNHYLLDTRFAAEELIRLISFEESQLSILNKSLREQKQINMTLHGDFMAKDLDPFDNWPAGSEMLAYSRFFEHYQTYLKPLEHEIAILKGSIDNKRHSINALAGSLLQIAKQGISFVHGGLEYCDDGRQVLGDVLKNVIWQGRNQSMHYEEGRYSKALLACFNNLGYATVPAKNLAKEVIDILGWNSYQEYETDMNLLLPSDP